MVAVGVGVAGCGGEEEPPDYVGAGQVCGGLFAGPLAKTVESVTGATSFAWSGTNGMQRVVDGLKAGYEEGRTLASGGRLCEMNPKGGALIDRSKIDFDIYPPQDLNEGYSNDEHYYTMGKRSGATSAGAFLYFECVSPQFKGSKERPLRVQGSFYHPKATAQNTSEHMAANMEILHAASLAVAKKLQCEKNGGLPEKPVLKPRI
ncbi:hypothetical protein ACIRP2_00470 [Streptomyces sp. NPDC101194]|uniref:hypothetical protein n=1 Tax=Streptomyces sp. NPDC101194 TaxID=3366127 RepID=UPI003810711F